VSNKLYVPGGRGNTPSRAEIAAHHANTWAGLFSVLLSAGHTVEMAGAMAEEAHKALIKRTAQFFTAKQPGDEEAS
jgi:hypothetical protein